MLFGTPPARGRRAVSAGRTVPFFTSRRPSSSARPDVNIRHRRVKNDLFWRQAHAPLHVLPARDCSCRAVGSAAARQLHGRCAVPARRSPALGNPDARRSPLRAVPRQGRPAGRRAIRSRGPPAPRRCVAPLESPRSAGQAWPPRDNPLRRRDPPRGTLPAVGNAFFRQRK